MVLVCLWACLSGPQLQLLCLPWTWQRIFTNCGCVVFMFGIIMLIQRCDLRTRREQGKETGKALILPKLLDALSV